MLIGFNLAGLFEANWRDTEIQRLVLFLLAVPLCLAPGPRQTGSGPAESELAEPASVAPAAVSDAQS